MISVAQYLEAATRPNTERAYAAATRHFEIEWGGHLPTTAEQVARYLAAYAGQLALQLPQDGYASTSLLARLRAP